MSSASLQSSESIRRISVLLSKYEKYQSILNPEEDEEEEISNCDQNKISDASITKEDNYDDADGEEENNGVSFVEAIDNNEYEHDYMNYDHYDESANHEDEYQSNEEVVEEDLCSFLDNLDCTQMLDDFNNIIIDHYNDDFQSIYNLIRTDFTCNIEKSPQFARNNRKRETQNISKCNNTELSVDNLVHLDLLDAIHCHLLHSMDIGYIINSDDVFVQNKDDEKNEDNVSIIINYQKLRSLTLKKRKTIMKMRGKDRITNNKFKTTFDKLQAKEQSLNVIDEKSQQIHFEHEIHSNKRPSVQKKHADLKTEILNNDICKLEIQIFEQLMLKAQKRSKCKIAHGMSSEDCGALLVENVIVLILFCDFDSFRCAYTNALNEEAGGSELYNFHMGLESTVKLFGASLSDNKSSNKNIKKFYHSYSSTPIFSSTKCNFSTVTSLSANVAPVALYNFDKNEEDGIILEFAANRSLKYFSCSWLSSFPAEDEFLFFNDSGYLEMTNVAFINPLDYENADLRIFVEALSYFDGCLSEGGAWKSTAANNEHYRTINSLRKQRMRNLDVNKSYERRIFDAFCDNKEKIELLVQNLRGPLCQILFKSDANASYSNASTQVIRFDVLCALFTNCRRIKTWYVANSDYNQASGISQNWMESLCMVLDDINKHKESKLDTIIICNHHQNVEPIYSAETMNDQFQQKFFHKGWSLSYICCSDSLYEISISKMFTHSTVTVESFDVEKGCYYISTDALKDESVPMKYQDFRNLFEEINKKIVNNKAAIKKFKKAFPSKFRVKKQNNEKLMTQRQAKLNEYFAALLEYANENTQDRMKIMTSLTTYLLKTNH